VEWRVDMCFVQVVGNASDGDAYRSRGRAAKASDKMFFCVLKA
jgi:hypothetical protein